MPSKLIKGVVGFHKCGFLSYFYKPYVSGYYGYDKTICNYPFVSRGGDLRFYDASLHLRSHSSTSSVNSISDDENVRYYNSNNELQIMKYVELKELATKHYNEKGRSLVQIILTGDQKPISGQTLTFRTMLMNELEETVRKNKQHRTQKKINIIHPSKYLTTENVVENQKSSTSAENVKTNRLKHKKLITNVNVGDHDLQAAVKRISKWLSGGTTFVTVEIKGKDKKSECIDVEKRIRAQLEDNDGLANLTVKSV